MVQKIKSVGIYVAIATSATILLVAPFVRSQPAAEPVGDADSAQAGREALGFGPEDVLPALAGDVGHEQMIDLALDFAANHEEALAPLVEAEQQAMAELVHRLTWNQDAQDAYAQLHNARDALASQAASLLTDLDAEVPPAQQELVARVVQNRHLDSDLRTINWTESQRQSIQAVQQERDRITLNARYWYNQQAQDEARSAFEEALQSIATTQQQGAMATFRQVLIDRRAEMQIAEAAALEGT